MRRHLGMSWAEWQALPWYEQRALRDRLARELNPETSDTPTTPAEPGTPEEEAALLASAGFTLT